MKKMSKKMDKQMIEEMVEIIADKCDKCLIGCNGCECCDESKAYCRSRCHATVLINAGYRKIPEGAVVLTDDELNEVIDTCKVSMIVTDDDGEKYISLDGHNEYTERLGKIVRQRKARIEYLEKLLDDRSDRCIERVRKETAEKFAEMLKALVAERNCNEDYDWEDVQVDGQIFVECVDEICKELTEGRL